MAWATSSSSTCQAARRPEYRYDRDAAKEHRRNAIDEEKARLLNALKGDSTAPQVAQERPTLTSNLGERAPWAAKTEENGATEQARQLAEPRRRRLPEAMEPLDIQDVQKQLIRCQHALDQARQLGWDTDLIREFEEATRHLHERDHAPTPQRACQTTEGRPRPFGIGRTSRHPPPTNRLLTPEERGEPDTQSEQQVDLLSTSK